MLATLIIKNISMRFYPTNFLTRSTFFSLCFSVCKSSVLLLVNLFWLNLPLPILSLFLWLKTLSLSSLLPLLVLLLLLLLLLLISSYFFVIVSIFHCFYSYLVNITIIVCIVSFINFLIYTFAFRFWISASQVFF